MSARLSTLWGLAWRLSRLGPTLTDRLWMLTVALAMPLKGRLPWARSRIVTVRVSKLGRELRCALRQRSDLLVLEEVFVLDAYEVATDAPPRVILDLGSNIGVTVLYFRLRYPDARIYGFEPDPLAYELLERNTGGLEGIHVLPVAVAEQDCRLPFYPRAETFASSLAPEGSSDAPVSVTARSLDSLARELGIDRVDLMKVDIEGAEFRVLQAFTGLSRVGTIIGELHVELMDATREQFVALLEEFDVEMEHQPMPSLPLAERFAFVARHASS